MSADGTELHMKLFMSCYNKASRLRLHPHILAIGIMIRLAVHPAAFPHSTKISGAAGIIIGQQPNHWLFTTDYRVFGPHTPG